jgi:DNA uptake protein ComE-like DNA-binding protein
MKKEFFREAGKWFGYSRRERRASYFLLLAILLVLGLRYIWPDRHEKPELTFPDISETAVDSSVRRSKPYKGYNAGLKKYPIPKSRIVELNSCDSADLEALPAIGPVLARRIIKYRNLLGGFISEEQLKEVYGLSDSTFGIISGRVKADPKLIRKINVNTADFRTLLRLPYLEKNEVNAILDFRSGNGRIENVDQLVRNYVISQTKAEKAGRYMEFGK